MAKLDSSQTEFLAALDGEEPFVPYWARSSVQCAQNLLPCSPDPIEYDLTDADYWDNCFFFPEDCSVTNVSSTDGADSACSETVSCPSFDAETDEDDTMTPELPDIKMLDPDALSGLLEDNISPPEITSLLIFATNGAIFAYASDLPQRQLRNLSATYGAAYTTYAKTVSSGNLTGVNPASHPSSFVTTPSVPLGDVGSIVFENDNRVAVVTKIADKVLLAAVGPMKLESSEPQGQAETEETGSKTASANGSSAPGSVGSGRAPTQDQNRDPDSILETQYEIDRNNDLARLAALNLNSSPEILLALESKSAALGRFLAQKLRDLECPPDF
ncbi:hypothetical protein VTN49DRAFT_6639 [Thermomyces lanuginosus]|uniref:uncharacterized protein n=1 Tax=Thermomyces lanuginosus TaxID=5541 RepID=UPI0037434465